MNQIPAQSGTIIFFRDSKAALALETKAERK
jgi:hypothetical protein